MLTSISPEARLALLEDGDVPSSRPRSSLKALNQGAGSGVAADVVAAETVRDRRRAGDVDRPDTGSSRRSGVTVAAGCRLQHRAGRRDPPAVTTRPDEVAAKIHVRETVGSPAPHLRALRGDPQRHRGGGRRGGQTDCPGAYGTARPDDYRGRVDADGRALSVTAIAWWPTNRRRGRPDKRKASDAGGARPWGGEWVLLVGGPAERDPRRASRPRPVDRWRKGAARLLRTAQGTGSSGTSPRRHGLHPGWSRGAQVEPGDRHGRPGSAEARVLGARPAPAQTAPTSGRRRAEAATRPASIAVTDPAPRVGLSVWSGSHVVVE